MSTVNGNPLNVKRDPRMGAHFYRPTYPFNFPTACAVCLGAPEASCHITLPPQMFRR